MKTEHLDLEEIYGIRSLSFSESFSAFVERHSQKHERKVLDLCCGAGQRALYMADLGLQVSALDIDSRKLAILHEKARDYRLNIEIFEASMTDLPFESGSFDTVICCSALHHQTVTGILKTISEIRRVCKSEGQVFFDILSISDASYAVGLEIEPGTKVGGREGEEDVPHHYCTREELEDFLRAFSHVQIEEKNYTYRFRDQMYSSILFEVTAQI